MLSLELLPMPYLPTVENVSCAYRVFVMDVNIGQSDGFFSGHCSSCVTGHRCVTPLYCLSVIGLLSKRVRGIATSGRSPRNSILLEGRKGSGAIDRSTSSSN